MQRQEGCYRRWACHRVSRLCAFCSPVLHDDNGSGCFYGLCGSERPNWWLIFNEGNLIVFFSQCPREEDALSWRSPSAPVEFGDCECVRVWRDDPVAGSERRKHSCHMFSDKLLFVGWTTRWGPLRLRLRTKYNTAARKVLWRSFVIVINFFQCPYTVL